MQKKIASQSSTSFKNQSSQFQMSPSFNEKPSQFLTPKKIQNSKIFVQTPQALFIPLSIRNNELITEDDRFYESPELQNNGQKNKMFNLNSIKQKNEPNQTSRISLFPKETSQQPNVSSILKSKVEISLKRERISEFFFNQNFIICKGLRKVIVYNSVDRSVIHVPIAFDEFVLTQFPPYVFNCITGQYLNLYNEEVIDKYAEIQRRKQIMLKKNKAYQPLNMTYGSDERQGYADKLKTQEDEIKNNQVNIVTIKISKLEVQCICKYGQTIYMGGYNRSVLPGGKRSERREVYLMENLDPKINNKPKAVIKIDSSNHPVSEIHVQMPYLLVYCRPTFYMFGLKSHELLLTFQKELKSSLLLQGRYAFNVLNGIGISSRSLKSTIFTYDVENSPIYGVEITEHKQEATSVCMEKTGRIFGSVKSGLFEYVPTKRITKCVKLYPESETIVGVVSTPSNNLLVLRHSEEMEYSIEVFSIEESSINDY